MKKIISKIILFCLIGLVASCSENDRLVDAVTADTTRGVVLRTLESSLELPEGTNNEFFTLLELQGAELSQVDRLEVYISFKDNTPDNGQTTLQKSLFKTIQPSEFTTSERLPRTELRFDLNDLESFFGIDQSEYKGGDRFTVTLELYMLDGRLFTDSNTNPIINGPFYRSPFSYGAPVICPVGAAFTGEYKVVSYTPAGPFAGDWTQGTVVNITTGAGETNRQFSVSWAGFNTTFRFDLLCGKIAVVKNSMGVGCSAVGLYYGPSPDGQIATYDYEVGQPVEDGTLTINFTDNADGDCGAGPTSQVVVLTKV